MIEDGAARQPRFEPFDVAVLGGAVDDHVEMAAAPGDHQIVDDSAVFVEQQRISQLHVREHLELARQQRLQRDIGVAAVDRVGVLGLLREREVEQRDVRGPDVGIAGRRRRDPDTDGSPLGGSHGAACITPW